MLESYGVSQSGKWRALADRPHRNRTPGGTPTPSCPAKYAIRTQQVRVQICRLIPHSRPRTRPSSDRSLCPRRIGVCSRRRHGGASSGGSGRRTSSRSKNTDVRQSGTGIESPRLNDYPSLRGAARRPGCAMTAELPPPQARPRARALVPGAAEAGQGGVLRQGTRAGGSPRRLIKSGMPHHGSRHHQRRVRCWLRQARRPDRGSGDVDQRGSAVAPQASLRLSVFTCELFEPGRRACPQWGGECPKTRTNADSVAAAVASILSFSTSRELTMRSRPCQVRMSRALSPLCRISGSGNQSVRHGCVPGFGPTVD